VSAKRLPRFRHAHGFIAAICLSAAGGALPETLPVAAVAQPGPDDFAAARAQMVVQVRAELRRAHVRDDARLRAILQILERLPREAYVPADQRASAYAPRPVPIGHGQTISDAFIMAYMTHALELQPGDRVLEIGTGSGYQAAILGSLGAQVHTIEIVPELARQAAAVLRDQGFRNISVRQGDGYAGWAEAAPFDAIIVTAGAVRIPPALVAQLRPGGRMILPLGPNWAEQQMTLVRKGRDGRIQVRSCGWVFFVPFVGAAQRLEPGASPVWGRRLSPHCRELIGAAFQADAPVP
jgi:protein-L-isoaspartate(D-aspartate) O-methyltransferase